MARTPFRFALEPELVVRTADRDRVEAEVQRLRQDLAGAEEARDAARTALQETAQQRAVRSDELFAPTTGEDLDPTLLQARSQYLDELRGLEQRQTGELAERERAVVLARHKLEAARDELAELESRIEALERAREKEHKAWKAEQEKLAEKARDEDASLRWSHENRNRKR